MSNLDSSDPVTLGLRARARQLVGVAVFSGVVNLLTLSGSLYMLQVYDRVIPSRNVSTLIGLRPTFATTWTASPARSQSASSRAASRTQPI